MKHCEFNFQAYDGLQLFGQSWQPENQAKAVVCLVHGLGEHSGRYIHVADQLIEAGYILLSFDLRGHGKSQGSLGHISSYEALMQDISSLLKIANAKFPQRLSFLYGHSLGGNLVLNYVIRCKPQIDGVIATAPWISLAFEPPHIKIILAQITNYVLPAFSQKHGLDTKDISRDPEVVHAYENDPLVHNHISARMFISIYRAGQWALEHASEFPLPLLLMQGGDDKIVAIKANRDFADRKAEDCTLKIWDGLYHEIHNEPEKQKVLNFLINWLDEKLRELF